MHGAKPDAGRGVAPDRLADDILHRQVRQLGLHQIAVALVCRDIDILDRNKRQDALHRELEHRFSVGCEREKLFGQAFSAFGPKTFAAAAGHDQRGFLHRSPPFIVHSISVFKDVTIQKNHI